MSFFKLISYIMFISTEHPKCMIMCDKYKGTYTIEILITKGNKASKFKQQNVFMKHRCPW